MKTVLLHLLLVWLIVWPLVTCLLILLSGLAHPLPLGVQTLILTGILVPLTNLVLGPKMRRLASHLTRENP
ncbi:MULTISPECIES: hypothetical protein [Erythrobacter]|uniref:Uncharacterized protein n=1 Tax=Erythrobacter aureus TaxID=2182384 RepID=A0A345YC92_9SPHN|nr:MULTISPECIES: hypothetical protein [Erythrobacter]AXK41544.1 hypothetical protein DVR09_03675 [Erythrobacter aureus]MBL44900.1 hypothetical protein [Sphingomonadaceae bacterium]MBQ95706.1 hypothetical protein [Actinomycetota bacterium]MCF8883202.1 hypothetical protein [Erythrobacter sp. SN021]